MDTATFEDIDAFLAGDIPSVTGEVTFSPEVELVKGHISDAVFFGGVANSKYFLVAEFARKESDDLGFVYEKIISLYRNGNGEWVASRRLDKMIKNRLLPFLTSRKEGFPHATRVPHEYAKRLVLRELAVYKEVGKTGYVKKMKRLITEHALA